MIVTDNIELRERVEKSRDTMRPYLKDDGGNVEIVEITEELVVRLKLVGACSTCPQSFYDHEGGY